MPTQPLQSICTGRLVAVAAAACLVAASATASIRSAAAQGHLEAEYVASIAGIQVGKGNWVIEVSEDQFSANASGGTSGLLRFFTGGRGTSAAHGTLSGGQPLPTSYTATIDYNRKIDDVRMALVGGNVKDYSVEPPVSPHPDRVPLTEADRHGVTDPLTSTINVVAGTADPISPLACKGKIAVFDGRLRYDLRSEFKRMETVKAERGYQGPVVVCAVYFTPIAGYVPDRPAIKFLVAQRDAEVWLAPISGTRLVVPFRFSIPTPIGQGVLQATAFVTTPRPPHPGPSANKQ